MAMFNLLKIRTSIDIFNTEECQVTFGLKNIYAIFLSGFTQLHKSIANGIINVIILKE